jgi:glycosyltransferase involved in cell wall biosynthesis
MKTSSPSKSQQPLVSILIQAYNGERYVRECLDSALAQTYENFEIIFLDDHSTDGTAAIVKEYVAREEATGSARLKYILPAKRLGIVEGRNELLRQAKGELLAWLDADDVYLPDKVKDEVEFLEAHEEFGVVYCQIGYFYDSDGVAAAAAKIYRHRNVPRSGSGPEMFACLLEKMFITNTAVMFRREIYKKLGGYRTDLGIVEDWEYFLRIAEAGYGIGFLDRDLVRYRLRSDSHTNFARQVEVQESAVKIFEALRESGTLNPTDRARYRIDYWVARRYETYAIALAAAGRGREARVALLKARAGFAGVAGFAKRTAIWILSLTPAGLAGFLVESAWNRRKKGYFVEV